MSNEEMVKEAVEEAKKAAEAEAKEQEAKGQEPEDTEETEATEEEAVGKETNSEDAEEPKKKKLFEKKNKKDKKDEQIADLTDKLTRHMAEFDNYRKRTEKEKSAMYEIGAKDPGHTPRVLATQSPLPYFCFIIPEIELLTYCQE